MAFCQFRDAAALGAGTRRSGRVLEVRNNVEELWNILLKCGFESLDVWTVGFERDTDHVRLMTAEERNRTIVCGRFGEHRVSGLDHRTTKEFDKFERAVAIKDLI